MKSNGGKAQHNFSELPDVKVERSSFNRSHGRKTTFNPGYIYPVFCDEVLPGDTHNLQMTAFIRMTTAIHPLMDNAYLDTHFFFVPNRLVWEHWKEFMGEKKSPGDSVEYVIPKVEPHMPLSGSIYDYYGLPILTDNPSITLPVINHSALPLRGYNLIYNEWFRDENLQNWIPAHFNDGPDSKNLYHLKRRGKRHDYFTSCLPWAQKGDPVPIPGLGADSVVTTSVTEAAWKSGYTFAYTGTAGTAGTHWLQFGDSGTKNAEWNISAGSDADKVAYIDDQSANPFTYTTTSTSVVNPAHSATINQLREAFQIQKLMETDARGGTRYTEMLQAHFGVTSPDSRLQRPEYLGGGTSPLHIQQVAQTSATNSASPQAHLTGYGTISVKNHGFTQSFTEHGFIHGFMSVRADLTYHQGLHKMWSRDTKWEHYFPKLAHLGEQAVLSQELFCDGDTVEDQKVFGYQERWAEYRYKNSDLTGLMRGHAPLNLTAWHLAQHFNTRPFLNENFIKEYPPFDRVVAVPSQPIFIADIYFKYISARPMPVYSVPGYIDHF